jgi:NADPH oxidase
MATSYSMSIKQPKGSRVTDAPSPSAPITESFEVEVLEQHKPWKEYEDSKYDSPILNRLVPFPLFYYCRWKILNIFHTRLLFGIVLGEVLFFLLLVGGLVGILAAVGNDDEGTGAVAIIPAALSFAFACRNSLWVLFTGLPFERALIWHKVCAYLSVLVGAWHGYVSREWDFTGLLLTGSMAVLCIISLWPVRRKVFEAFLRLHWVLFLLVIGAAFAHEAGAIVFGAGLWAFDVICRALIALFNYHKRRQVLAVRLPSNVIRITFLKEDFKYKAGQYCFICVPGVSLFEWHPFSMSSSPHENKVSIHIRVLGDWTEKLYDYVAETRPITVYFDGPYGAPCLDIDGRRYKHFLFVSGGIGITPMQSICNDIMYQRRRGRDVQKAMFVWSVRDLFMVSSVLEYDKEYFNKAAHHRLPYSFSPDLLVRDESQEVMENYFHLTRERDSEKFSEANIDLEIQPELKFGRPDLPGLFTKMKGYATDTNAKRVAVLSCGPANLVSTVEKLCVKHSSGGVTFDFHKEVFEF